MAQDDDIRRALQEAYQRALAHREVRALERLREHRRDDWQREHGREEQRLLDELAGRFRRGDP